MKQGSFFPDNDANRTFLFLGILLSFFPFVLTETGF